MSNSAVIIKPVAIDDVPALSAVAIQAYNDHYLHLWYDGGKWYKEKSFSFKQLAQELEDINAKFFIIYVNGRGSGFLKINIDAPLNEETNALELERIYFVKEESGKGVGTTVMKYVFQLAGKLGKNIVWLKVMDSSTTAISFYKKHGFEICGTYHLDLPKMKEELRGMYIMKKNLKSI